MKITLIIGLPASGKSTLAFNLKTEKDIVIDDPSDLSVLPDGGDMDLIITDPNFCDASIMQKAMNKLYAKYSKYELLYDLYVFENNPAQCLINAKYRKDKKVDGLISHLSSIYYPEKFADIAVITLPVFNKEMV